MENGLSRTMEMLNMEEHADLEHEIWGSWMKYMFSKGTYNEDGTWTMPKELVERWSKQMNTVYKDLTEKEKNSDREQVEKHIKLIILGKTDRNE